MGEMPACDLCGNWIVNSAEAHRVKRGTWVHIECHENTLFEVPPAEPPEPLAKLGGARIWTEHKAKLIARYLYYFVLVTKHGTYIDGFAGPQDPERPDTWAAKLVLGTQPRWMRNFHLFDADHDQIVHLLALKASQPPRDISRREPRRSIEIYEGDFNTRVRQLLASGAVSPNEATFCLLDQRTFECEWTTVQALSRYKTKRHKIELFYFLPNMWLDRALAAKHDTAALVRWWGRTDVEILKALTGIPRAQFFVKRIKDELGYASVKAFPIYERAGAGHTMYFMIHATDHVDAPRLMARAYRRAVLPAEPAEQLLLELGLANLDPPVDSEEVE